MSHDRKSPSCRPSHRRRSARATRLPSGWRRSSESPRPQRKLDDARSEAVARSAEAETHVAARDRAAAELAALRHDVDSARRDLDDATSQASARRGEAAEHLAAGEQARAELLAMQEQIRAETRALNEQET